MQGIEIAATRHIESQEAEAETLCYSTALANGRTAAEADRCDDFSVNCSGCPFRKESKPGLYSVDFDCEQLSASITVFNIKAVHASHAERLGRECLSSQLAWRCTGTDRTGEA